MSNGYDAVVANGIRLFEEQGITGWARLIDMDELDIWSYSNCIAGQVFRFRAMEREASGVPTSHGCGCCAVNGYDIARELIGDQDDQDSVDFGFCPDSRFGPTDDLIDAWKDAIAAAL